MLPSGRVAFYPAVINGNQFSADLPYTENGAYRVEVNATSGFRHLQRGGLPQHNPDHPDLLSYFPRSEETTDAAQLAGYALGPFVSSPGQGRPGSLQNQDAVDQVSHPA